MTQKLTIQLILPVRKDEQSAEKARAAKAYYEKRGFEVVNDQKRRQFAREVTEKIEERKVCEQIDRKKL
jgi:F0F1-type ATP synthase gamma subunit